MGIDIISKPSKPAEPYFPAKVVFPRTGEYTLQCGKCSSMNFKIHVKPNQFGLSRVTELICIICLSTCDLDQNSMLQANGKKKPKKRSK